MDNHIPLKPVLQLRASDVGGEPFPLAQLGHGQKSMNFIMARVVSGAIEVLQGWRAGGLPTLAECRLKDTRVRMRGAQIYTDNGIPLLASNAAGARVLNLDNITLKLNQDCVVLRPGPLGPTGRKSSLFINFKP